MILSRDTWPEDPDFAVAIEVDFDETIHLRGIAPASALILLREAVRDLEKKLDEA